jgi:hypothetical protein
MAGEGLIWSALGQGIANAGSTMSQYMFKDIAAEEAAKEKRELLQERLAATERENARNRELRLEIAESRKSGGGGGTGGLDISELAPGGKLANMAANKMGLSEPEYKKLYEATKTGDKSGYEEDATEFGNFGEENKVKKLPKGFEDEFKAKQKTLGNLQEQYALAGKFDDVAKGRQIEFGTKMGQTAFDQPEVADKAGQAVAVAGGKPLVNVEGGEKYNQYTGKSETTPVGKSQITENVAQAGQAGALAKKYGKDIEKIDAEIAGGMFSKNSSERLTSIVNSANATIKSLMDGGKGATPEAKAEWQKQYDDAVAIRTQATTLQKNALDNRDSGKPTPKPDAGGMPEPKSAAEVAKLKPGTRFKAPDGSIRIR